MTVLGVLALGILIGPVNLFVLTKNNRPKLFFTIPIIAAAASLLFVIVILMEDGIGGNGKRVAFITLAPESATATIYQQQASRCGALLGTSFSFDEPTLITPVSLMGGRNGGTGNQTLSQSATEFSGDWFKSRQKQIFNVSSVIPSRARIDVSATSSQGDTVARKFTNTTNAAIHQIHFVDQEKNYYMHSGPLNPGDSVTISAKPKGTAAVIKNGSDLTQLLDSETARQLTKILRAKGQIIAFAENAPELCLDTLDSIEWDASHAVLIQAID